MEPGRLQPGSVFYSTFFLAFVTQNVCYINEYDQAQNTYGMIVSSIAVAIAFFGYPTSPIANTVALAISLLNFPLMWYGKMIGSDLFYDMSARLKS